MTLDNMPACKQCRLTLTAELPTDEVKGFIKDTDKALKTNAKKLSQALTRAILEKDTSNQLDKLLKIIQVSDLAALSEILDNQMVSYIRGLFKEANIATESFSIMNRLKDRFPYVDEDNIDELAAAFKQELQKAIHEARIKHKGKKVRINLF